MVRKKSFFPAFIALSLAGLLMIFTGCPEDEVSAEDTGIGLVREQDVLSKQNSSDTARITGFEASKVTYFTKQESTSPGAPIAESDDPFTIIEYGPREKLPAEVEKPGIYVMFSQASLDIRRIFLYIACQRT